MTPATTVPAAAATPPLSILHVDPERAWGGGQAQLIELTRHLAERGHQQTVACRPDGALRPVLQGHGIAVCDLRIRNDMDLIAAWRLRRVLQSHRVDVVHFQTARAHALAPWLPRRACFVVTRHMDYRPHFTPRVRFLYNRSVDGVIAVSEAIADVLASSGVDRRRVRVIHVGIDCRRFNQPRDRRAAIRARWGAAAHDLVLFTTAVLEPRKGHDVLLQAIADLCRAHLPVRWIVCGDGSQRTQLEARARDAGVAERVVFTGFSPNVAELLTGADVFVLPSRFEGLGIAVIEAMAAGLPVIASRVGGIPEIVAAGETGLLVPAGEPAALAAAITRIAADREWAQALGSNGRQRALGQFSSTAMAAAVEAYYYALLG